jgi:4a-hydroxytetrahydrobiopterin dehydratase
MISFGWAELNNKFEKIFKFKNYNDVVLFSNKVMQIAIKQDHHPEIHVHFSFVKVFITDYEKGATSEKCLLFINEVDKIIA